MLTFGEDTPMHPEQIDVFCLQLLQASCHGELQALRMVALVVGFHVAFLGGPIRELRRQNHLVSVASACQPFADPLLALFILLHISYAQLQWPIRYGMFGPDNCWQYQ